MENGEDKSIEIRVIKEWSEFEALKEDWQNLLEQSDANHIFLNWEWIDCWRKSQSTAINPLIIVIKNSQQTLAIAPFYIQEYRLANLLTYQSLRFVGDQNSGSEYSNFIVKAERCLDLKSMLWAYLLSPDIKLYWDFIWFTNVASWTAGGTTLLESLEAVKPLHYHCRTVEFAQVVLGGLTAEILPNLSKSLRTNIRQTRCRLDKIGPWQVKASREDDDIGEHLEKLFTLHNKHWQHLGRGTFQRRPELVNFYRNFVPLASQKGWLRLLRLESGGEVQAMQLGYVFNDQFLAIQEGYNPDYVSGIGQVLRYFSYKSCKQEGVHCYDFLGVYTDHKRRWLAEKKHGKNLFIWHRKMKNLPFEAKQIWPTGRYLKPT
ncbi:MULTISPECIES: GNAT family N-acetyltransferase [unclassified Moritella]|uniref:GNAT family N-acetyltransferase n=1 Tax=unclassified Moritella TaxID=2637987 RepID=UPI001BA75841|nr:MULTISPECIES: GNAT family N-acetyltransferase [unclassified Moritella]QUM85351.1 GNAT family N-acetyltransferase [Moritella sp. 28]QUM89583.1 GNAT family N-acetyltransferase [Moritella sp. 36]